MARLPKTATDAVALLDLQAGQSVLCVAPATGYAEAIASTVGEDGKVLVQDPPPELDDTVGVEVVEELPLETVADVVIVWTAFVAAPALRSYPARVADGGTLWAVLPRVSREEMPRVSEADVKRTLLVAGWRDSKTVALASDAYGIRFTRRR